MNLNQNITPSSKTQGQSIVIVDDTPDNLRLLTGILRERGYKVRPAPSGVHALATIQKEQPDLILLDIMMPDMDGYEVCRRLKADNQTRNIPIIFLSALNEVFDKVKAFKAGGVDYISKPFQMEEVLVRVNTHLMIRGQQEMLALQNEELKSQNQLISDQANKLKLMATKDFLTGLSNRRDFLEKAKREKNRFSRSYNSFSIIMIDIDDFKNVNDTYGHECGDKVLIGIARVLEKTLRSHDIVARWGGEEFVCMLPETNLEDAAQAAEKIRTTVETVGHECGEKHVQVTLTLGVCAYGGSCSIETCIRLADDALYNGKRQGRNRVVLANNLP